MLDTRPNPTRRNFRQFSLVENDKTEDAKMNHGRSVGVLFLFIFFRELKAILNSFLFVFFFVAVMKLNVITKAKGSAYIELGNTKVIVSVFDPREVQKQANNFK